ncbi:MAG TPA: cyclase family protein [Burkholderiales bacterium]
MSDDVSRRTFVRTAGVSTAGLALANLMLTSAEARHGRDRDRTRDFIRDVKQARLFDLSFTWDENSPIAGVNPPYAMELAATHANTLGTFGDGGKLSFTSEIMQWSGQHGAPSIDAIGHIGRNGKLFGGVDAVKATSDPRGLGRSGVGAHLDIAHYPKEMLVNRAVLLDVARFINRNKREALAAGFDITGDMLHDTARHQGVRIERGDTVLIRTGWGKYFKTNPDFYKGDAAAGVGVSGARFLVREKARVVGNDTLTFEVRPPIAGTPGGPDFEVFPVHMLLIPDNGINIIENYFLEEIAAAEEYEFILVVPPIKIRGGTGSALRSFALVP